MGLTVSLLSNKVFSEEQLYLIVISQVDSLTRGEFSIASIIDKTMRKNVCFSLHSILGNVSARSQPIR